MGSSIHHELDACIVGLSQVCLHKQMQSIYLFINVSSQVCLHKQMQSIYLFINPPTNIE